MKHETWMALIMLAASFPTGSALAAADPPQSRAGRPVDEATFKTLDIDGDGYVSRLEVRRGTSLERSFDRFDIDRDGRLSREELRDTYKVELPADTVNRTGRPAAPGERR